MVLLYRYMIYKEKLVFYHWWKTMSKKDHNKVKKRVINMSAFFDIFRNVYHFIYIGIMLTGCVFIYYQLFKKRKN